MNASMRRIIFDLFFIALSLHGYGQVVEDTRNVDGIEGVYGDSITAREAGLWWADVMHFIKLYEHFISSRDSLDKLDAEHRLRQMDSLFSECVCKSEVLDDQRIDTMPFMGVVRDTVLPFVVLTYEYPDLHRPRYRACVVMPDRVVHLEDEGSRRNVRFWMYRPVAAPRWLGGLYYNALPLHRDSTASTWMVFGYRQLGTYHRRKFIDVLTVGRNGGVHSGRPVFYGIPEGGVAVRYVVDYSREAFVHVNYDTALGRIMMDHLCPLGRHPDGSVRLVPDGTYSAFVPKGEKWYYVDKVFKDPPRREFVPVPSSSLDKRRDLFGRERKERRKRRAR